MKSLMNHQRLGVAVLITATLVTSLRADETAVAFDDSSINVGTGGSLVDGWQFSTLSDIQVSALGLYDYYKGDGFSEQHPVGIWEISNPSQPLVSAVIPAGTVAPLVQDFRYVTVDPVTLPAGHDYAIGALYIYGDATVGALNAPNWLLTVGPGLQFDGRRFGGLSSSILTFPENYAPGQEQSFGPNFTYTVVPEPSLLTLCVLGATVLLCWTKILRLHSQTRQGFAGRVDLTRLSVSGGKSCVQPEWLNS